MNFPWGIKVLRKLLKVLTQRLFWFAVFIVIQFALLLYVVLWASYAKGFYLAFSILSVVMLFVVFTRSEKPAYKMVWMFLIGILPVFGGVLYLIMANKKLGYFSRKKTRMFLKTLPDPSQFPETAEDSLLREAPEYSNISKYIRNVTGMPAWGRTECSYFYYSEEFFLDVLNEIRDAKRFIFIEYFIIGEGKWWKRILGELVEKVKQGVDVRIIYDDMGSINSIPGHYDAKLRSYGIKAVAFNRVKLHLNPRLNFRDHRKIFDIDGVVCYTGGLNLADEYANDEIRFGYWKDNAVKFRGAAVWNFTFMFLEMWNGVWGGNDNLSDYLPSVASSDDGFVQPFGDNPFDDSCTAEDVYIQMIANAKRYVWITTPYLIPDDRMMGALKMAAASGVDVRIITPHYPDKKTVFEVSRSNYIPLLKSGVKIFEYMPGFIHSKTFLADDSAAVVGTTNIDYRSFYLHFELSVLFIGSSVVQSVKEDFLRTFEMSEAMNPDMVAVHNPVRRFIRYFLRLFSPAF